MTYDLFPAINSDYQFPPEVRQALAISSELRNMVIPMSTTQRNNLTTEELWDGRIILNTTTYTVQRYNLDTTTWSEISGSTDVQIFTDNGMWFKPPGCKSVHVLCIGGGGGGGSGRRGASATIRCGGGGGGGGGISIRTIPAYLLNDIIQADVGISGNGGYARSTDNTDGQDGGSGGYSTFGGNDTSGFIVSSGSSERGRGGTATSTLGGPSGGGMFVGGAGGAGNDGSIGPGNSPSVSGAVSGGGGGAGGGGINASNQARGGGASGSGIFNSGGYGVLLGGSAGNPGLDGQGYPNFGTPGGGGSGGGGASAGGAKGGDGGMYGGGGGGGGASMNGSASGAGGKGGPGIVIVTSYF